MNKTDKTAVSEHLSLMLLILAFLAFTTVLSAGNKEHLMQGDVTALGTTQDTTGGDTTPIFTHTHRTYTVKTDTRFFVLECPYDMEALHILAPSECGGKSKIAIGDTIHFRVEKNKAFLLDAQGTEEKLRIVSESMNADGNAAPVASQHP